MAGKRVSIREVAQAAGVSITTVSHTLSGARSVKPSTREQVLRAVEQLGYRPDPYARGMRGTRSYLLGLVGDRVISTPHASAMVLGAQSAAAARGSFVAAVDSGQDPVVEARQVEVLTDHRVDGVVYARMYHQSVELPPALGGTAVVLLDASCEDPAVSSVVPDEHGIAVTAVRHLASHGHRRIGFVTTDQDTPAAAGREEGYRVAVAEAGLVEDFRLVVRAGLTDAHGGREATAALLALDEPPTAVLCFNDRMAMGAYQAADQAGLSVPDDLSVVGVDNLLLVADALVPGLTTVEVPHERMGRWAVDRLLDLIERPEATEVEQLRFRCELVERGSVSAPRPGG